MPGERDPAEREPRVRPATTADLARVRELQRRLVVAASAPGADVRVAVTPPPAGALEAWAAQAPALTRRVAALGERPVASVAGFRLAARVEDGRDDWGILSEVVGEDTEAGAAGLAACLRAYGRETGGLEPGAAPVLLATVRSPAVHHALRDALGFEVLRDLLRLEATVDAVLAGGDAGLEVGEAEPVPTGLEHLAAAREVGFARDTGVLAWRALRWPDATALVACRGGEPVGWLRVREARASWVLEDWIVHPEDHLALRALVQAAAERARAAGVTSLVTTCADTQAEWWLLQEFGFRVGPMRAYLLARTWRRPVDPTWLYERFAFTPADLSLDAELDDPELDVA